MFSAVFSDIVIPLRMISALMRSTFSSLDTPQHDCEIDTCGEFANAHFFFSILLVGKANMELLGGSTAVAFGFATWQCCPYPGILEFWSRLMF